jgi:tRNA(Ile)-lysidine synthase
MRPAGGGARHVRRPILQLRRAETAALVGSLGLQVVADPSNFEMRFRRNRVRHQLLPVLAEVADRDPVPLLARTAALLGADAEFLATLAGGIDATDTGALRAAPKPVAIRALRTWLREGEGTERHPPSSEELQRAWAVVTGEVVACEMAGGRRLSRHGGRLRIEAKALKDVSGHHDASGAGWHDRHARHDGYDKHDRPGTGRGAAGAEQCPPLPTERPPMGSG